MASPRVHLLFARFAVLLAAAFLLAALPPTPPVHGATFTVNSTGDGADSNTADNLCNDGSGNCTLRAAIQQANVTAGLDTINFNVGGGNVQSIAPLTALPVVTGPVTIDGTTQPSCAVPCIELRGDSVGAIASGLQISGGSTIKGLVINRWKWSGIDVAYAGAPPRTGNLIESNYIGTSIDGGSDLGNLNDGITVSYTTNSTIRNNVISGNGVNGVYLWQSSGITVKANLIGTDWSGAVDLGNDNDGVHVGAGSAADSNTIGGPSAADRNIISGNGGSGVDCWAPGANVVQGNYIGTDITGTQALGNSLTGVTSTDDCQSALLGNVISGNGEGGVEIRRSTAAMVDGNVLEGNYIGTNVAGTAAIPNAGHGVFIIGGGGGTLTNNLIGGSFPGEGNLISGNSGAGVYLGESNVTGNFIQGNYIGTDASGLNPIPNFEGVALSEAAGNIVGGAGPSAGNLISGNAAVGVRISGITAAGNVVQGNRIGTDATGDGPLGNQQGVYAHNTGANTIGGPGAGNTIAHNSFDGILIVAQPGPSTGEGISANSIYSNAQLGIDLDDDGVTLNDPGDSDTGANAHQNYPVINSAESDGSFLFVEASLNSTPNTQFRVEFFASGECDASGYGEGEVFLGSTLVQTAGNGNVDFNTSIGAPVQPGVYVTATATDPSNNTSEFSLCGIATPVPGTPTPSPSPTVTPTPTSTGPTPTPTVTPTPTSTGPTPTPTSTPAEEFSGDVDCDDDVDSVDALKVLRHVALLSVNQNQPCPKIGSEVASKFGDVDCDNDVDAVDALRILRYVALLPNNLPAGCGPIGPSATPTPTPTPHPGSIDQKLTGDPACAFANFRGSVSGIALAQEFVPSMSTLLGVDICLSADGAGEVDLNIRDGTAAALGAILASVSGTAGAGDAYLHFDLTPPLSVTPGHMLVLELPQTSGFAWLGTCAQIFGSCTTIDPDLYPPGKASYFAGDFAFRTYGSTP